MQKVDQYVDQSLKFYDAARNYGNAVSDMESEHSITKYDFHLLATVWKLQPILLRDIIKQDLVKKNQVNKSVKSLYELKMINKYRMPNDERTVELSINPDKEKEVKKILMKYGEVIEDIIESLK